MDTRKGLALELLKETSLQDINGADDVARLARIPTSVVLDALRSGALSGREFSGLGWRITKRAALNWLEGRATQGAFDAV